MPAEVEAVVLVRGWLAGRGREVGEIVRRSRGGYVSASADRQEAGGAQGVRSSPGGCTGRVTVPRADGLEHGAAVVGDGDVAAI